MNISVPLKGSVGCASHFAERELCRLLVNSQLWWYTCVIPELRRWRLERLGWATMRSPVWENRVGRGSHAAFEMTLDVCFEAGEMTEDRLLFSKRLLEVQESGSEQTDFRSGLEFYGD